MKFDIENGRLRHPVHVGFGESVAQHDGAVRGGAEDWNVLIESGALTAEELMRRYTRIVFAQAGTIEETARRLDLDRRTVKARLA